MRSKQLVLSTTLALCFVIAGCASPQQNKTITLKSIPQGASVVAFDQSGLRYEPLETTDFDYTFKFNKADGPGQYYDVQFSLQGYEPQSRTVRITDLDIFEISVQLAPSRMREIVKKELSLGDQGYTIEPRIVRAWVEDIEREGLAPSSIVKLSEGQSISGMCMSKDGKTLVFSLLESVIDNTGKEKNVASLKSISTQGGGITEITSGQWMDAFPALDINDNLLFCSDRLRKPGELDIFRVSLHTTGAIAVIRQTPEGINHQCSISDNGIISFSFKPDYAKQRIRGLNHIWTLGGENQYPTQLREGQMPAISPDGTQIAFIGMDHQLWKIPVNGQNPVQLTSSTPSKSKEGNIMGKRHPVWSPDGKYIIYVSDEGKDGKGESNFDIWMISEEGTGVTQLMTNGSEDIYPVVAPDQKYIYFVSNRGFKEGIWRIPFLQ